MDSNTLKNKLQDNPNQQAQRIPSKLLRYKFEVKATEVRKKKLIGTRCHFSTSFKTSDMCKSVKDFRKVKVIRDFHYESPTRPQFVADPIERNLLKKLGVFSRLQKLKITYGNSSLMDLKTFKEIVKGVKRITNLKEFQLNLPPSNQYGDEDKFKILGKSLRRLANLERIVLNFDQNYYLTANGLYYLTQSFRRLTSLKTLTLSLKHNGQIGDEALQFFSQHLKKYSALENFSLVLFRNTAVGDLGLQYLSDGLKNLTNLKSIKLGFRAEDSLNSFLSSLLIKFLNRCDQISDIGVDKLFEGLQKLERIWINFRGCDRITDAGPKSFGEKFEKLKSLKKLTIKFRGCDKITDEGMIGLMRPIRVMGVNSGCLEDMTLIFSGCRKLTYDGFWQIWHALQQIGSLKTAQLGLKNCKNLTQDTVNQMVKDLKKVNPGLKFTLLADNIQIWQGVGL